MSVYVTFVVRYNKAQDNDHIWDDVTGSRIIPVITKLLFRIPVVLGSEKLFA